MPLKSIIILLLVAGLAIPWLGACSRVSRPEQDLRERLAYNEAVSQRYKLDPQWWKVYNDEQLNLLVGQALANNIDLAKAAISVNKALYQAELLGADLVPSFSGKGDSSVRKDTTGGATTRSYGGNLGLSYELDLWQRVADSVSAQEWAAKATVEDKEATRLALIGSVVDAYYNLAYLNDAISAAQANLRNYQNIGQTVEIKHQAGKVAAVEQAQASQTILNAENSLTDYQTQKKKAEQTLRNLLNLKPEQALPLIKVPTLASLKLPGLDLNIPLSVLANRPDLRAAEFRLERALKNVDEAEKAWLPSITLNAALNSSGQSFKNAFSLPVASGAVAINLPFLQWDKVRLNLRISEEDFESVRLDFEKALTTALNEVDTYYYNYGQSHQNLDNLRRKYAYDVKIGQHHRDRYEAGAGELADWLGALNTINNSRLSSLSALYQVIQQETLIYKALAGRYTDLGQARETAPPIK